jgi:hypothetical protein
MSMYRAEKTQAVETVQQELGKATVAVLAEYRGLTAGELDRLRKAGAAGGRPLPGQQEHAHASRRPRVAFEKLTPHLRGPVGGDPRLQRSGRDREARGAARRGAPKLEIKCAVLDGNLLQLPR